MILLCCPCCGQEADEFIAPGLYINARLSVMSDILTTRGPGPAQAPAGFGAEPRIGLHAVEAGFLGRPEPMSASWKSVMEKKS